MLINQADCYYVYAYLRENGTPYYIGKGKGNRMHAAHKRGKSCIVPRKNGTLDKERIEIIQADMCEQDALLLEMTLVKQYGRMDLGSGILANLTDGGDGASNMSLETRTKISKALAGIKRSSDTIERCKKAQQKRNETYDFGPVATKANRTRYNTKKHWISHPIHGTDYGYITELAEKYGIKVHGFYNVLKGKSKHCYGWVIVRPLSEKSLKAAEINYNDKGRN